MAQIDTSKTLMRLAQLLGEHAVITGPDIDERYCIDWTSTRGDMPLAVVRPSTTEEVSGIMQLCAANKQPVIVQGGRTGLAGGALPIAGEIVMSQERMTCIEEVDIRSATTTVQSGATLQAVQAAVQDEGLDLPLDLGARGSATIGGIVSTNAGGNRVIRYGMARSMVMGLEVVLPDGRIINTMRKFIKDNTGYDLTQLFVGAEGTLGVITRALLRLQPMPRSRCAALCTLGEFDEVVNLLKLLRAELREELSAYEVMWRDYYTAAMSINRFRQPISVGHEFYVLVEALGGRPDVDQEHFVELFAELSNDGAVHEVVIAQSDKDINDLWAIRDSISEIVGAFVPFHTYDVSFQLEQMESFVAACRNALDREWPDHRSIFFGHIGDGNLHLVTNLGTDEDSETAIDDIIYDLVRAHNGSISAEHGIGIFKKAYLAYSRSEIELDLMRSLKETIDPAGILNPGRIIDSRSR